MIENMVYYLKETSIMFYKWSIRLFSYAIQLEVSDDNRNLDVLIGGKFYLYFFDKRYVVIQNACSNFMLTVTIEDVK